MNAWWLALGTLTALPTRPLREIDRHVAGRAILVAPVAVAPLVLLATGVGLAAHAVALSPLVIALLLAAVLALGTRGLHWDGLSDVADALTASYDPQRSLAVMKSGASGPAGTVAVALVLGLQVAGLASLTTTWRGILTAALSACLARSALTLCCLRGVPSARSEGLGVTFGSTVSPATAAVSWLLGASVLSVVAWWAGYPWWRGALAAGIALGVVAVLVARCVHRLGGVTGDVFGAGVELATATLWVALA